MATRLTASRRRRRETETHRPVDEAIRALQAEEPEGAVHAAMVDWRTLIAVGAVGLSYLATQHLTRTRNRSARDPREATELLRQQPDSN
jgi:hypothetical protein